MRRKRWLNSHPAKTTEEKYQSNGGRPTWIQSNEVIVRCLDTGNKKSIRVTTECSIRSNRTRKGTVGKSIDFSAATSIAFTIRHNSATCRRKQEFHWERVSSCKASPASSLRFIIKAKRSNKADHQSIQIRVPGELDLLHQANEIDARHLLPLQR